jgi:hypothetical protein
VKVLFGIVDDSLPVHFFGTLNRVHERGDRMDENTMAQPEASEALDFEVVSLNEDLVAVNRC